MSILGLVSFTILTKKFSCKMESDKTNNSSRRYIKRLPDDPWGNPYQYKIPGENGDYDLFSLGADGDIGGEGDNSDIGNW